LPGDSVENFDIETFRTEIFYDSLKTGVIHTPVFLLIIDTNIKENIFLKNIDFFKLCGMLKYNIGNATIPIIRKEGYLCYVKAS